MKTLLTSVAAFAMITGPALAAPTDMPTSTTGKAATSSMMPSGHRMRAEHESSATEATEHKIARQAKAEHESVATEAKEHRAYARHHRRHHRHHHVAAHTTAKASAKAGAGSSDTGTDAGEGTSASTTS